MKLVCWATFGVSPVIVRINVNECYTYYMSINYTIREISWADPGGTAIPGQPVTEVEQAPSTPSFSKNHFHSGPAMQDV